MTRLSSADALRRGWELLLAALQEGARSSGAADALRRGWELLLAALQEGVRSSGAVEEEEEEEADGRRTAARMGAPKGLVEHVYVKGVKVKVEDGGAGSSGCGRGGAGEAEAVDRALSEAGCCSTERGAIIVHPKFRHTLPRQGFLPATARRRAAQERVDFSALLPPEMLLKIFESVDSHRDVCALAMTSTYISSVVESDDMQRTFWARMCRREFNINTSSAPPAGATWKDVFRFNHSILREVILNDQLLAESLEAAYPVLYRPIRAAS